MRGISSLKEQLSEVLAPYRGQKGATITILQKVQEKFGYLSEEAISEIAKFFGLSKNEVYGVATFYAQFRFTKQGEQVIRICQGTACHVRGSARIMEAIEEDLDIHPGETSKDSKFSLEGIACFGACALAPVMVVNKNIYGRMTTAKARQVLREYQGTK
ncbi:MAG: NADH-quinone oxidoreductase subunit NuoE [Chloroflexi bacterium]|nr:NADH-quinone oxidoreductase subunit NuoE [Chloroflexota bacterium]